MSGHVGYFSGYWQNGAGRIGKNKKSVGFFFSYYSESFRTHAHTRIEEEFDSLCIMHSLGPFKKKYILLHVFLDLILFCKSDKYWATVFFETLNRQTNFYFPQTRRL